MNKPSLVIELDRGEGSDFCPSESQIHSWAVEALLSLSIQKGMINISVVDLETIHQLNHTYRKKDKPTNVLSFPSQMPKEIMPDFLGDILICAPVVNQEAQDQHKPLEAHWAHLVVHGTLHLLGYDHMKPEEASIMEGLEKTILAKLGFPDPYQE